MVNLESQHYKFQNPHMLDIGCESLDYKSWLSQNMTLPWLPFELTFNGISEVKLRQPRIGLYPAGCYTQRGKRLK